MRLIFQTETAAAGDDGLPIGRWRAANLLSCCMPWTNPFWKPIKLNDGGVLSTLGEARELIAMLPALKQAEGHWRDADEMLVRAEAAPSAMDDALAAMVRALKAEGLI
jgi:hypothetical protein